MPPFREDVMDCFHGHNRMREVLAEIAHSDEPRAREKARAVLAELKLKWEKPDGC